MIKPHSFRINNNNVKLYIPASWERLITLVKHQALTAGHSIISAEYGAGKSACIEIVDKKFKLNDKFIVSIVQVTPLMTAADVRELSQAPSERPHIVLVDDAHDASEELLGAILADAHCSWFLFGEPLLTQRLNTIKQVFNLPAFQRDDCHNYLSQQLGKVEGFTELSNLKSDRYFELSAGKPAELIRLANEDMDELLTVDTNLEHFERSNSSWISSVILGLGILVFLGVLMYKLLNASDKDKAPVTITPESVSFIDANEFEPSVSRDNENGSDNSLVDVIQQSEALLKWTAQYPKDYHTIQLFSHELRSEAQAFLETLDLADSYIVVNQVNDTIRYRVIWGAYATRAEAESSKLSLPSAILEQKPWIRPLSVLLEEI